MARIELRGIGKLFRDRYRLQRFGRGGFIRLCLRTLLLTLPACGGSLFTRCPEGIEPILGQPGTLLESGLSFLFLFHQ